MSVYRQPTCHVITPTSTVCHFCFSEDLCGKRRKYYQPPFLEAKQKYFNIRAVNGLGGGMDDELESL